MCVCVVPETRRRRRRKVPSPYQFVREGGRRKGPTNKILSKMMSSSSSSGLVGAGGVSVSDGSWTLSVFVTDLQVERQLRVRGDLHVGGVMIRLVDELGRSS